VHKDELLERFWPGTFISESALTHCLAKVRKAVHDDHVSQHIIKTVRGHGYRFVAAVTVHTSAPATALELASPLAPSPPPVTPMPGVPSLPNPQGDVLGERKQVTVLVAGLKDVPALAQMIDAEVLYKILQRAATVMRQEVQRLEGDVIRCTGEHLIALFGTPVAQEDYVMRALHAALGIQRVFAALAENLQRAHAVQLDLGLGVHAGTVVIEPLGAETRADAIAPSLPIYLAERLQGLATRIDRLPPEAKQLLQTAAVIGHEMPLPLLQEITALPEADLHRDLAHLQAAEFLYETRLFPEREYTFKHALTHEVAYSSLLQERRRTLHARIVTAVETCVGDRMVEEVERLAHHALRGEVWDKALVYCRQAGRKALTHSSLREALVYFEQALAALNALPDSPQQREPAVDLRLEMRNILIALGEFRAMFDYLSAAEALAKTLDDQRRLGWVSAYLSPYFHNTGDQERAVETGHRALAIAQATEDFALEVMATFFLGLAYIALGEYRQAADYHRRDVALLTREWHHERFGESGLPAVFARVYLILSLVALGEFAEGKARGAEAMQIAETVDQPFTLGHACWGVGLLSLHQGDLRQAIAALTRSLEVCQAGDIGLLLPWGASALGYAYLLAGRLPEALPLLQQAVEQDATQAYYPLWLTHLSEAYLLTGRLEDAQQLAQRALELSRDLKQRGHEVYALRLLAEVAGHGSSEEVERAEAYYRQALSLADTLGMRPLQTHCHFGLGTLYGRMGRRGQAQAALSTAVALYRSLDMPFWLSQAAAARTRMT
jgi:tetratricopeptide (TPR) repeat protein